MLSIAFDAFSIRFGKRVLFDAISAELVWDAPGVIGLMGPSGSGKSTLINAILTHRYLRPLSGLRLDPSAIAIVSVPQQPVLYPQLSVAANARLFEQTGRFRAAFDAALFEQLIDTLRLRRVIEEGKTDRLSGGEAQRLMLLRSLSVRPNLLLLDEPCAGLDAGVRAGFLADLSMLVRKLGCAAIYVGHHWEEIAALADIVAYLQPSVATGSVETLTVMRRDAVAATPPTPDAFQAIYGPMSSIWPVTLTDRSTARLAPASSEILSSQLIGCLKPQQSAITPILFETLGRFRLAKPAHLRDRTAFVYEEDRFMGIYPIEEVPPL